MSDSLKTMLEAMPDSYQKTVGFFTYDLLAAAAIRLDQTEQQLHEIESKLDPENLSGDELDRYIYPRTGQRRNPATHAIGAVTVFGTGEIREGDLFESGGGIQFAATQNVSVSDTATVPVRCTAAGTVGNLPSGSITMMPVQLSGIVRVTNQEPTHDGYDAETDEAYYQRFLIRVQTPPTSGNVYHYLSWALEVAGVGAAQVYPLGHGDNTVDVVIIDAEGMPASADLVAAVQRHIDPDSAGLGYGQAPIGAYCYVSAAQGMPISITVQVTPLAGYDHAALTKTIKERITSYLKSIAFKQKYLSYAKLSGVILDIDGVLDFEQLTVNGSVGNVAIADRKVAVMGEVTVTYAT